VRLLLKGKVSGNETVASADPFVLLEIKITGQVQAGPNGTLDGTLTLTEWSCAFLSGCSARVIS
jgi:hypothetical protein